MNNPSGIIPIDDRVLVRIPKVEEKTAGGIIMPEQVRDKEEQKTTECRVIAVGSMAFRDFVDLGMDVPIKAGDMVCIARYAGQLHTGDDGREYRIVNSGDIAGVKVNG